MVFLTTHSDPDSGDLHVEPDNKSSSNIESVSPIFVIVSQLQCLFYSISQSLSIILGGNLSEFIQQATSSVLVLLTCGGPFATLEGRYNLDKYVSRSVSFHIKFI